jgi:hypothetical protein
LHKSQSRSDRAIDSLIARSIGYHTGLPEAERKRLMSMAGKARKMVEKAILDGKEPEEDPMIPSSVFGMIRTSFISRQHWDQQRTKVEASMAESARLLPVWPWVKSISGVAELGLSVLVGEAGDIGNYSGPGKLWKRLGLACFDGTRQGMVPKEITGEARKEAWIARGYNPARRAEVWAFLDDMLVRAQWRGDRDEDGKYPSVTKKPVAVAAHSIGPYGKVYGERKAWNYARGLTPIHADRDARRFMAKRFIRDLWVAWQEANVRSLPLTQEAAD